MAMLILDKRDQDKVLRKGHTNKRGHVTER